MLDRGSGSRATVLEQDAGRRVSEHCACPHQTSCCHQVVTSMPAAWSVEPCILPQLNEHMRSRGPTLPGTHLHVLSAAAARCILLHVNLPALLASTLCKAHCLFTNISVPQITGFPSIAASLWCRARTSRRGGSSQLPGPGAGQSAPTERAPLMVPTRTPPASQHAQSQVRWLLQLPVVSH